MARISMIVPCYNEQATIRLLLDAICNQTVPNRDLEVIIADGRSTDRTREVVAEFQRDHPDLSVRLVDNPQRYIPSGLNRALEAAQGEYIIRLDGHSIPAPDYVERCLADLDAGLAENVGGVWEIRPRGDGLVACAIAVAAAHPFGVGDALYRYTSQPAYVDTVPFGAFRREVFDRLGMYDERLLSNEDYEFNARIRQSGGRVYLDPQIHSVYFARANLRELAKQYWRYGYWKWRMLRRYPGTLRWRQFLPPVFVLSLLGLILLAPWWGVARVLLGLELVGYFLALAAGSVKEARRQRDWRLVFAVPLAIATMHVTWGTALLWSAMTTRGPLKEKS
jgi:succinoglycan biosynthesis protein ExoA